MSDAPARPCEPALCHTAADVTPDWLTAVLRNSGALTSGSVAAFTTAPIGTGQMADSIRFALTYDGGDADGPGSVVGKFASSNDTSRATGLALRAYEAEVGFYREVAATVAMRVPRCHAAVVEPATGWFSLILDDMAPATQGDQLGGCSVDTAVVALDEAARLHAPRWGDPTLASIEWLSRSSPESRAMMAMLVGGMFPGWVDRYGDRLDEDTMHVCRRFIESAALWMAPRDEPLTVQHGDYRLDNMLLGDGEQAPVLAVVDWQTVVHGPALIDVSYFLGNSLVVEDRRRHEDALVREYHGRLQTAGVEGYGWDQCWQDYRHGAFFGVLMAIAASMLVVQTDRGDEMFLTNVTRAATHVLDLEALDLLDAVGA